MAGHQIAINLASLSFMVPLGIGAAASTRVGNAIGRGDQRGARRAAEVALSAGGAIMVGSALVFGLLPSALARIYSPDAQVIAQAAVLIRIAALFQIFDGTQAVGCGVLRGAGDTRAAMVINLVGYWVLGLPLGVLWAFRLHAGPRGLWWGLTLGLAFVAVLLTARIVTRFRRDIARV
jgi:MATE family multidrug resistance protein